MEAEGKVQIHVKNQIIRYCLLVKELSGISKKITWLYLNKEVMCGMIDVIQGDQLVQHIFSCSKLTIQ